MTYRRRSTVLLVATVTAAALSWSAAGAVAGAAPRWASTHTKALTPLLSKATTLGALASNTKVRIDVGLAPRNTAALQSRAISSSMPGSVQFGSFLTPAQFTASFAPTSATVHAVTSYLTGAGFTAVTVDANRLMVSATGTAGRVDSAFHTLLNRYRVGGRIVFANAAPAMVPASLAGVVDTVLGLNDIPMNSVRPTVATPKTPLSGYYPKEFQKVYGAVGTPTGSTTAIAVITEGDLTGVVSDLRYAESKQGLPAVPLTIVRTGPASTDTSGADEWDLDTQVSTGMAQTVKHLYLYDGSTLTDFDIAHSINVWVSQDVAKLASASIGEPDELAYLDGSMLAIDTSAEEGAAQGQSFFASTGDTGASCAIEDTNGAPDTGLTASLCYPADGTWTTAVGGTTLVTDTSDNYEAEIAWNAGGGGVSEFEYPGPWTDTANHAAAGGLRGDPDIAMDADITTGANIYVDKTVETIGGTSVSSPLSMGAVARVDAALSGRLGVAVLRFYGLYNKANPAVDDLNATPGFHDIIAGSNGLYSATPGWDYTTGIGSIDVALLIKALK